MDTIQQLVSPSRASEIENHLQEWHQDYVLKHNIETDELKDKILNIQIENILFNLKQNPELSGNLCIQKPSELLPTRWKEMMQLKEAQDLKTDDLIETDMFQCSRCNSKKCTYFTLQTRGGDEGETQFISCLNCSKRWKQ